MGASFAGIGGAHRCTVAGYRAALDTGVTYVAAAHAYRDGDGRVIGGAPAGGREM